MRLFVGIELPFEIRARLAQMSGGVPGAKWADPAQMHLTLRFIGEVDGVQFQDIDSALAQTTDAAFDIRISGIGMFGSKRRPRLLWAGVEPSEPVEHLQAKVESALVRAGLEASPRKFHPHITLARLRSAEADRLGQFIETNGTLRTDTFPVAEYQLFSSRLSHKGAIYRREAGYGLKLNARAGEITPGPGQTG